MLSLEAPILAAWCGGLAVMLGIVQAFRGGALEVMGVLVMFLVVLLILDRRRPAAALIAAGYCTCCVIVGCMAIDAAFDAIVLADAVPALGVGRELSAREVAWIYYHVMLNTPLVNATVTFCCAYLALAALALGLRSEPRHRARWGLLVPLSAVGNGAYVFVIVPRYYQLRSEATFDPAFFDHWEAVAAARLVALITIFVGMPLAFPVLCDLASSGTSCVPARDNLARKSQS